MTRPDTTDRATFETMIAPPRQTGMSVLVWWRACRALQHELVSISEMDESCLTGTMFRSGDPL